LVVEAAHTFSDILTSAIAFIGFKLGLKPADREHPYGHGRAEPLMGLLIVFFLAIIAYEIFSQVYYKLTLGPALQPPELIAAVMALVGVAANYVLTNYSMKIGKQINSPAIIADANHQKVDIYACLAIFGGVIGSQLGYPILDPLVGAVVGLLIIKTAYEVAKENVNHLMGKVPSDELIKDITTAASSVKGIYGAHSVKCNYMGPYASAELHVEVDGDLTLKEAHELAHNVEKAIIERVDVINAVTVHVCPVDDGICLID